MKSKAVKIALDLVMTILMVILMDLSATGIFWHELFGLSIFGLFMIHLIFNRNWIKSVTSSIIKGNKISRAKKMYALDALLLVSLGITTVSGILISQAILPFLASADTAFWLNVHTSSSYASLIIISIHLGLHWKYIMGAFRNMFSIRKESRARTVILRTFAASLVVAGIVSSFSNNVGEKLLTPFTNKANGYAVTQQYNKQTTELIDTSSLSSKLTLVSTNSASIDDSVSLEDYLGNMFCTACGHHCSLLSPRCGRGVNQAQNAESEYYAALEASQSEAQTQEETQSTSQSDSQLQEQSSGDIVSEGDYLTAIDENSSVLEVPQSTEKGNLANTFTAYIPMMSIYIAGTHYIIDFKDKRKKA